MYVASFYKINDNQHLYQSYKGNGGVLQRPARDYEEINEQLRSKSSIYNNTDDKDCDQDSKYDSNEFLEDLEIEDNDYNYPSDNNDNARTEEHNFHYSFKNYVDDNIDETFNIETEYIG
jgi:hypothetical protein